MSKHIDNDWYDESDDDDQKLYAGEYKVDPRRLPELLGFEPPGDFRLPLDPVRKLIVAAAETWLRLRVDYGIEAPTTEQLRLSSPEVRDALTDLYGHLATYDARRCPAPIPQNYVPIREMFLSLIKEIHHALPGAPPLNVEVVFIGKDIPVPNWAASLKQT